MNSGKVDAFTNTLVLITFRNNHVTRRWTGSIGRCLQKRHFIFADTIIPAAESCTVKPLYDTFERITKIVWTGQYKWCIKQIITMFFRIRLSEYPAEYLLYIYLWRFIRYRCKNIRKRAVPAFFKSVDCNYIADRTVTAHKISFAYSVNLWRFYCDLFFGDSVIHKHFFQIFKSLALLTCLWLSLKQNNRSDIIAAVLFFLYCLSFECITQINRIYNYIVFWLTIINDNRQLDHILLFKFSLVDCKMP